MRSVGTVFLSGLVALGTFATGPARAADFDEDYPPRYQAPYAPPATYNAPYAPPPPVAYEPPRPYGGYYSPPRAAAEECRTYVKPRIDEWGRQVTRRVRVCDDVVGDAPRYDGPRYAPAPYAAAPAGVYWREPYDRAPRPPADVGVEYYR